MKKYLIITLLFAFFARTSQGQTLAFPDMVDLVNLSIGQIENVLIGTGKFKVNDKKDMFGQLITTYQSINKEKKVVKGETMAVGAYRTTGDGTKLKTITYLTVYREYIDNLMKQIRRFVYRQTFKGMDTQRTIYIFDNQLNHITVLLRADHTLNSIEIRQKELGIEP